MKRHFNDEAEDSKEAPASKRWREDGRPANETVVKEEPAKLDCRLVCERNKIQCQLEALGKRANLATYFDLSESGHFEVLRLLDEALNGVGGLDILSLILDYAFPVIPFKAHNGKVSLTINNLASFLSATDPRTPIEGEVQDLDMKASRSAIGMFDADAQKLCTPSKFLEALRKGIALCGNYYYVKGVNRMPLCALIPAPGQTVRPNACFHGLLFAKSEGKLVPFYDGSIMNGVPFGEGMFFNWGSIVVDISQRSSELQQQRRAVTPKDEVTRIRILVKQERNWTGFQGILDQEQKFAMNDDKFSRLHGVCVRPSANSEGLKIYHGDFFPGRDRSWNSPHSNSVLVDEKVCC